MHMSNIRANRNAITGETPGFSDKKHNKQRILYTTNETW